MTQLPNQCLRFKQIGSVPGLATCQHLGQRGAQLLRGVGLVAQYIGQACGADHGPGLLVEELDLVRSGHHVNLIPEFTQALGRRVTDSEDLGIDRAAGDVAPVGNALGWHGLLQKAPSAGRLTADDGHGQLQVAGAAGNRADDLHLGQDFRQTVFARHAVPAGLETVEAGMPGRTADGTAAVGAQSQRAHARGQCSHGAAARATGGQGRVPGIAGQPGEGAVGVALQGEFGDGRLAQENGARRAQPCDR